MEELDNNKNAEVWVYTDSWAVANGLSHIQADGKWKTGLLKGCPFGAWTYGGLYGN